MKNCTSDTPCWNHDDDTDDTCEGHADTDEALTSGVGIGESIYCDGSCNPRKG